MSDTTNLNQSLRAAARAGHAETLAGLLAAGADIHAEDDAALREAAYQGHLEVVRVLLGPNNVYDGGMDPRGYRFFGLRLDDGITVAAGCGWLTLDAAREHWADNPDALARVERIAEWASSPGEKQ